MAKDQIGARGTASRRAGIGVKSVEIGYRVFETLLDVSHPLNLSQIASSARITRSSARRYLISLVNTGLVTQDPDTHYYSLGQNAIRLGIVALGRANFLRAAIQTQEELVNDIRETTVLSVWGTNGPYVVNVTEAVEPVYLSVRIGTALPLIGLATGEIWAAFMPAAFSDPVIERECRELERVEGRAKSSAALSTLQRNLPQVRKQRLSVSRRSLIPESLAAAVPLMLPTGRLVAVLAVIAPKDRFLKREKRICQSLTKLATRFAKLGTSD